MRTDFSRNIIDFFKAKIKRLYPVFIFALLIGFVLSLFHIVPFNIYNALLNFFGLLGTPLTRGLCNYSEIHVFWYVACMLWTFALYYYIIQNLDKKWSNFVIAIIVFFSYAILVLNHWTVPYTIFGIFSTGILRALGGVGVGYFLGNIYKKTENTEINLLKKVKYTILE